MTKYKIIYIDGSDEIIYTLHFNHNLADLFPDNSLYLSRCQALNEVISSPNRDRFEWEFKD